MRRFYSVVIGLTALAFAGAAPAALINIETDLAGGDRELDCGESCEGFFEDNYDDSNVPSYNFQTLKLSNTDATAWAVTPSNPQTEVDFLDSMVAKLDPTETAPSEIYFEKIDGAGDGFTTNREYFWIKQGDWTAYFRNSTPGQSIVVDVEDGYSHYGVAGVPIPPAFLLFGSALLGMGWLSRRQRARKDRAAEAVAA